MLLIEVNPHLWFQQRFIISSQNLRTLFSVVHIVRFFGPPSPDCTLFEEWFFLETVL